MAVSPTNEKICLIISKIEIINTIALGVLIYGWNPVRAIFNTTS